MDVSVVVVSFNTRELLAACLRSIYETANGLSCEVIVVDNASSDGSAGMVSRDFPGATLIRSDVNLGFARANNVAIRASSGRYVLALNSDAQLLPGTLQAMVGFLDDNPCVAVVGAQLLNPDGSFQGSYADFPSFAGELLLMSKLASLVRSPTFPSYPAERSRKACSVDWVFGACMMARRAAIDVVGLLDEDYFMYTEETDWCYRMRQAGWQVYYLPGAVAVHRSRASAASAPERHRSQVYRSKCLFMQKHRSRLTAWAFRRTVWVLSALKLLVWSASVVAPGRRRRALQEVRSYALLLSEL